MNRRIVYAAVAALDVAILAVGITNLLAAAEPTQVDTITCQVDSMGIQFRALDDGNPYGLLPLDGPC